MPNASVFTNEQVHDARGLLCRDDAIFEDCGQLTSLRRLQSVLLTAELVSVDAQSPAEDQSDRPKVADVHMRQADSGLIPWCLGKRCSACYLRQTLIPVIYLVEELSSRR